MRTATAALAAILAAGNSAAQPVRPTVAVLVDVSASVPDADRAETYRKSFENAAAAASAPGARLVVGTIGAATRSGWVPLFDAARPARTGYELEDAKAQSAFTKRAKEAFAAAAERAEKRPDRASCVTDSLEAVSEAFAGAGGRYKALVVLSDMVEDGADCVRRNAVPAALRGVDVHVAGAGGNRAYAQLESRWRSYFSNAGARVVQYGRFPAEPDPKGGRK